MCGCDKGGRFACEYLVCESSSFDFSLIRLDSCFTGRPSLHRFPFILPQLLPLPLLPPLLHPLPQILNPHRTVRNLRAAKEMRVMVSNFNLRLFIVWVC